MNASTSLLLHQQNASASPRARVKGMCNSGITLRRIALESGVKSADIKAWLEGGTSAEEVENRLVAWLEDLDQAAAQLVTLPWVETSLTQRIHAVFEQARRTPTIGLVYGAAGCSKTTAALRYAKLALDDRAQTFYCSATVFTKTPTAMLYKLAETIYARGGAGAYRNYEIYQDIARRLGAGDLLLIDEAHHLEVATLDAIRAFHDDEGCGVCFLGNSLVFTRISGKGRRAEFAQLDSRAGARLEITAPAEHDIDVVLEAWGVKGSAERQYLHQIGSGPGGLRQLANVVRQSRIVAQEMKRPLDAQILRAAASLLGIDS